MDIKHKILKLVNDYLQKHDKNPTKLYLTSKDENELILLPETDPVKGPRHTFKDGIFNNICPLEIVWDAKEFKVE